MRIATQPAALRGLGGPICAAMGVFDGVHRGHQSVIRQAVEEAARCDGLAAAITFDLHPQSVVSPARAPLMIQPVFRRLQTIAALGVEAVLVLHFDERFSRLPAEAFLRELVDGLGGMHSLAVGGNFTFGHQRSGDAEALLRFGGELGFLAQIVTPVMHGGLPVSSTRIREAIRLGDFVLAASMLGRPYGMCGRVVEGDRLGRQLGFPTANLAVDGLLLPPLGVYAARVEVDGKSWPAVVNLGRRPTVASATPELRCEAHLLDWQGDLYGRELEAVLVERLRGEEKFESLAALKTQISRDVTLARLLLAR
jgi:riboflavin kinase/FMN adenylyltransferase